jgi:hypothetical protein
MDKALSDPTKATKVALAKAGIGGSWMITVWDDVTFQRQNGWYRTGAVEVVSTKATSVTLTGEQPKVLLTVCLDTSKLTTRFQSTKKPVPLGPSNGKRHKAQASMTYAPPAGQTTKSWFLIDEKDLGSC